MAIKRDITDNMLGWLDGLCPKVEWSRHGDSIRGNVDGVEVGALGRNRDSGGEYLYTDSGKCQARNKDGAARIVKYITREHTKKLREEADALARRSAVLAALEG